MAVFVGTSGPYALLNRDDSAHRALAGAVETLIANDEMLLAHSYVLVETTRSRSREVSQVDHVSFELMHRRNVRRALAVDMRQSVSVPS